MLETLNDEQMAMLNRISQDWRRSILTPGRVDTERMRPYLAKAYAAIGKKLPKIIVRDTSPCVCLSVIFGDAAPPLGHDYARIAREERQEYNSCFHNRLLTDTLHSRLHVASANHEISHRLFPKLLNVMKSAFVDAYATTRLDVLRHIETTLGERRAKTIACSLLHVHQQFLAADLSYYQLIDEIGLLSALSQGSLAWLSEIVRGSYCCWLGDEFCLFCDKPSVKLDERDRPHCEDGPAVSFERSEVYFWQQHEYYAWHGVIVPERVILNPESQTAEEIKKEVNQEVRRIRIERLGWLNYLRMTGATILDTRRSEIEGTDESLMHSQEGRILVCACPSTARVYALEVPLEISSCEQAQNWLSGGLNRRITAAT